MLVSCNTGCKINGGTTEASLDLNSNEVICNVCGDNISGISKFTKLSMKNTGDVIKEKKRAFTFECSHCDKRCEVEVVNHKSVGKNCQTKDKCMFKITSAMKHAIEASSSNSKEGDENDDEESKGT